MVQVQQDRCASSRQRGRGIQSSRQTSFEGIILGSFDPVHLVQEQHKGAPYPPLRYRDHVAERPASYFRGRRRESGDQDDRVRHLEAGRDAAAIAPEASRGHRLRARPRPPTRAPMVGVGGGRPRRVPLQRDGHAARSPPRGPSFSQPPVMVSESGPIRKREHEYRPRRREAKGRRSASQAGTTSLLEEAPELAGSLRAHHRRVGDPRRRNGGPEGSPTDVRRNGVAVIVGGGAV